ncbi:MAG: hypothetical protein Q9218_002400 [Villophora microphyllina]
MESEEGGKPSPLDNGNACQSPSHREAHTTNANDQDLEILSPGNPATRESRSSPQIKPEPSDDIWIWKVTGNNPTIDLTTDDDELKIKTEEVVDLTFEWKDMAVAGTGNCIELSDSEDDDKIVFRNHNADDDAKSRQAQDMSDAQGLTGEGNSALHGEVFDAASRDRDPPDGTTDSSNGGTETGTAQQSEPVNDAPRTNSAINAIRTNIRPPNRVHQFTPEQRARIMMQQQRLGQMIQGRVATGNRFGGSAEASSSGAASGRSSMFTENPEWWMEVDVESDAEATRHFNAIKKAYMDKKHRSANSFEDDVMWGKAVVAEKSRLKEAGKPLVGIDVDSDEEDSLFLPQGSPSHQGTQHAVTPNGTNEHRANEPISADLHEAEDNVEERDIVDVLGNDHLPTRRQLARNRAQDREESMQVGLEGFTSHEKREKRKEARSKKAGKRKAGDDGDTPKPKKTKSSKSKGKGKGKEKAVLQGPKGKGKRRATQPGFLFNGPSLFSSNVFEEANANVDAPAAPQVWEKRKDAALKAMLVNVPLEDLRQARSEKKHILESTKILGKHGRCSHAADGKWNLKGMTTTLYSHQVQGAAWMNRRETGESEPLGGLLSDQMGLGKTLQILACMVSNQATPADGVKATLIVCTTSLVYQWEQEIRRHTDGVVFKRVLRHHAGHRFRGSAGVHLMMAEQDIIITTYDEVRRSYPAFRPPGHIVLPAAKRSWWEENYDKDCGYLHQVHWYRVVLDEAQAIKNRDSQTSIACRGLMAKHRWAVSATPILNCIEELYPYFKLLRVKHTGDYDTFKENFCDPDDEESLARLHSFLRQIMMRRTHSDKVMGHPIITLPRNTQNTITLEFNTVERAIYDSVHQRFIESINQRQRNGTLERSYSNVLTMLLRLRQMTAHPFMLQSTIENMFRIEDVEKLMRLTVGEEADETRDMLKVMKDMIAAKVNSNSEPADVTPDSESLEEEDSDLQADNAHPLVFTFRRFLRKLVQTEKWAELKDRSLCTKCRDVPDVPYVTSCYHLYCMDCLRTMQQNAAAAGDEGAACHQCAQVFEKATCCSGIDELEMDAAATPAMSPRRKAAKEDLKWIDQAGQILPSTKTAAVCAQIEEWQQKEPDKKIIVFSQFHDLMTVLSKMFTQRSWGYYTGKMNQRSREKALEDFELKDACKIMIASLRAGGVGLNLTMASKVICVDLWWNSSVEQQAFCRVFRIGQEFETCISRFVVKNTVDETLLDMQKKKEADIRKAIDSDKMLEALSLPELMSLFGDVEYDENNKPFIKPFRLVDDDGEFDKEAPPTMLRSRYVNE